MGTYKHCYKGILEEPFRVEGVYCGVADLQMYKETSEPIKMHRALEQAFPQYHIKTMTFYGGYMFTIRDVPLDVVDSFPDVDEFGNRIDCDVVPDNKCI